MAHKNKKNTLGIYALFTFPLAAAFLLSGCMDTFNIKKEETPVFPEIALETMKETRVQPVKPAMTEELMEEGLPVEEIDEENPGTVTITPADEFEPAPEEEIEEEETEGENETSDPDEKTDKTEDSGEFE